MKNFKFIPTLPNELHASGFRACQQAAIKIFALLRVTAIILRFFGGRK